MRGLTLLAVSIAVVLAGVLASSQAATQGHWVIRDLGTLDAKESYAYAITERGQVLAWTFTKTEEDVHGDWLFDHVHDFLWQNGKTRDLGRFSPLEINDRDQMLGYNADTLGVWEPAKFTKLGSLGGGSTFAEALNNLGQVVGWSDPKRGLNHAFLWQKGRMRDLGTLVSGDASHAKAINDRSQVVGIAGSSSRDEDGDAIQHVFLWQNGKMRDLGGLGGNTYPSDINERGQVVGTGERHPGRFDSSVFFWDEGVWRNLGPIKVNVHAAPVINDRGQAVWQAAKKNGLHVMLFEKPKSYDLGRAGDPFDLEGEAARLRDATPAINDQGQVIWRNERSHATLWQAGKTTDLGTLPGGKRSGALAINDRGQIVGWSETRSGLKHAVLWTYTP